MIVTSVVAATEFAPFGQDPWWLVILKVLGLFLGVVILVLLTIWAERRVVARMNMRVGPNRVGPFGVLQGLMDGIKLALKEDIMPTAADKAVFFIAPIISCVPAFMALAVIPFGPEVSIFGVTTPLQLTDFPVAVLYILAISSIGIYGIVFAGWSSGSTYPLLGSLRSSAQMISYEIAMGLSFVAVFLYAGSMSTSQIVAAQQPIWYALILLPSFIIYVTAMVGETNRAPFDLPEAESELVAGFHTEYSSLKFALFFLAEYINMVTVSALATTLFLGGWQAPWPISAINDGMLNRGWWGLRVVHGQGLHLPVHVHLAARHAPPVPLRPVHEVRLEGPDPGVAGLDRAGRDVPGPARRAAQQCHDRLRDRHRDARGRLRRVLPGRERPRAGSGRHRGPG